MTNKVIFCSRCGQPVTDHKNWPSPAQVGECIDLLNKIIKDTENRLQLCEIEKTALNVFGQEQNAIIQRVTQENHALKTQLEQARADILAVSKQVWESGASHAAGGEFPITPAGGE